MSSKNNSRFENTNFIIESDEKFLEFLAIKKLKPATVRGYKIKIKEYSQAIGLTPSEFIKEAEIEEDNGIKLKRRKIKGHIIKFIQHLREKEYKETSISNYLIHVKSFYHTHDIEIPKIPIKLERFPKKDYNEWISKNDIQKAIKFSNKKYKSIILLMASSGMGSAEIRSLKFADFLIAIEGYTKFPLKPPYDVQDIRSSIPDNEHVVPNWNIKRIKTGEQYYTYSSPESVNAILDYLEHQEAKKKKVNNPDGPLFIGKSPEKVLDERSFNSAFRKINDDAGFERVGSKRYFTSHELRRFFSDQIFKAGMTETEVKWLRGQIPKDTLNRYIKPDPKNLEIKYMEKALPCLSIESVEIREIDENAYRRLKNVEEENFELREELHLLRAIVDSIIDPKTELAPEFMKGREKIVEYIKANQDNIDKS